MLFGEKYGEEVRWEMPEPTVFVVDDDESVRKMLRWLIESVNLQVEEYTSADDFLASYKPNQVGCIILDVRMPGMSGIELQQKLFQGNSQLPVILLTGHGDVQMAVSAMKNGAFDFVEKPFNNQNLLDIVQKGIAESLRIKDSHMEHKKREARLSSLTTRERQVFDLIVAGQTNKSVARHLDISQKTVEVHRSKVMAKLVAKSLSDLINISKGNV